MHFSLWILGLSAVRSDGSSDGMLPIHPLVAPGRRASHLRFAAGSLPVHSPGFHARPIHSQADPTPRSGHFHPPSRFAPGSVIPRPPSLRASRGKSRVCIGTLSLNRLTRVALLPCSSAAPPPSFRSAAPASTTASCLRTYRHFRVPARADLSGVRRSVAHGIPVWQPGQLRAESSGAKWKAREGPFIPGRWCCIISGMQNLPGVCVRSESILFDRPG